MLALFRGFFSKKMPLPCRCSARDFKKSTQAFSQKITQLFVDSWQINSRRRTLRLILALFSGFSHHKKRFLAVVSRAFSQKVHKQFHPKSIQAFSQKKCTSICYYVAKLCNKLAKRRKNACTVGTAEKVVFLHGVF